MRKIDKIVIHGADTPAGMNIGVEEIRRWHTDPKPRGRGWRDIGYHWVVRRDGTIEPGRLESVAGAHAKGHNRHSIGVCLVGGKPDFNYTHNQMSALKWLVHDLLRRYPDASVCGHRDLTDRKTCPNFDVAAWYNGGLV